MLNKKFFCKVILGVMIAGAFNPVSTYSSFSSTTVEKFESKDVVVEPNREVSDEERVEVEPVITEEEAIKKATEFMALMGQELQEEYIEEVEYDGSYKNGVYGIYCGREDSIRLSVDAATGDIIDFYSYSFDEETSVDFIEYEEAKEIALKLFEKMYPDKIDMVELKDTENNSIKYYTYDFNFQRVENGIPFVNNYINISVNMQTSEVQGLEINWNEDIEIPVFEEIKDKAEMEQKLKDDFNSSISYSNFYNEKNLSLVYNIQNENSNKVNAVSGEFISNDFEYSRETYAISEEEKESYIKAAEENINTEILSRDEIEKKGEILLKDIVDEDAVVSKVQKERYISDGVEGERWSIDFEYDTTSRGRLNLNEFGELESILFWDDDRRINIEEEVVSQEELYKKAVSFIVEYMPSKVKELNLEADIYENDNYINGVNVGKSVSINFNRFINGVGVPMDRMSFSYNPTTGELIRVFSMIEEYRDIESVEGLVSEEEAKENYSSKHEAILGYEVYYDEESEEDKVRLVYVLERKPGYDSLFYVKAKTGELLDSNGVNIGSEEKFLKDIESSKYKNEIKYLYIFRDLDISDFDLNKEVMLLDYIDMIYGNMGSYTSYYDEMEEILFTSDISEEHVAYGMIRKAIEDGILPNEEGSVKFLEPLTREEFAKYVSYSLGYGDMVKNSEYFNLPYDDIEEISEDNRGYVAIASMTGAMEGEDGNWNPKDKVTMEELLKVVYEVLAQENR